MIIHKIIKWIHNLFNIADECDFPPSNLSPSELQAWYEYQSHKRGIEIKYQTCSICGAKSSMSYLSFYDGPPDEKGRIPIIKGERHATCGHYDPKFHRLYSTSYK